MLDRRQVAARCKQFWVEKFKRPFAVLSTVDRITCVIVGVLGGLFPVPMVTTAVTLGLSALFGFRAPQIAIATTMNFVVTPAEIAIIPTLARTAALLTGADTTNFTASFILEALNVSLWQLLTVASSVLLHAVVGWAMLAVVVLLPVKPLVSVLRRESYHLP